MMREKTIKRCLGVGTFFVVNESTVRETAYYFGISKTVVYKYLTEKLPEVNPVLAKQAGIVLQKNKAERHIRGGLATKARYLAAKAENKKIE